jgi:hypothetical protein
MSQSVDVPGGTIARPAVEPQQLRTGEHQIIPPGPASLQHLRWKQQKMVRWLSPPQLAVTGLRAVLSAVFGSYTDRRELQAGLSELERPSKGELNQVDFDGLVYDYTQHPDAEAGFWIDYVADLGDGFASTYTVAWLLAQPGLPLPAKVGDTVAVSRDATRGRSLTDAPAPGWSRRGHLLVMGGDQVYPTASRDEYTNRLVGPYDAALPWTTEHVPHLFAVPGNHDWYDGLSSFLRLFCKGRWIGAWRTQQRRSYFALQLPANWWLLGIDVQFESDIDEPQRDYFGRVAKRMKAGDRVILCTAEPTWVHTAVHENAYDNLAYFERRVLPAGVEVALTLTGDLHHYSRYSRSDGDPGGGRHKITAGGGGAYLLGTSLLPRTIDLPTRRQASAGAMARVNLKKETFTREQTYPTPRESIALKAGAPTLTIRNFSFAVFMGCVYALYAWFLESASRAVLTGSNFMELASSTPPSGWRAVLGAFWASAAHSPLTVAFSALIVVGLIAFTRPDVDRFPALARSPGLGAAVRSAVGAVHGLAQISLAVALLWLFSWLNLDFLGLQPTSPVQVMLFLGEMVFVGGVLSAFLLSLFLLPPTNYNDAFSAQHLNTFKNFLRIHLNPDTGALSLYAFGVPQPPRWTFHPNAKPAEPYFDPTPNPEVRLIDHVTLPARKAP